MLDHRLAVGIRGDAIEEHPKLLHHVSPELGQLGAVGIGDDQGVAECEAERRARLVRERVGDGVEDRTQLSRVAEHPVKPLLELQQMPRADQRIRCPFPKGLALLHPVLGDAYSRSRRSISYRTCGLYSVPTRATTSSGGIEVTRPP
jgi:hypothetical protein